MNILTIIVLAVIGLFAYGGYREGFFEALYSLLGWVLVLGIVTSITPCVTQYIEENTGLQKMIQEKCIEFFESSTEKEEKSKEEEKKNSQDILLPHFVVEDVVQSAADHAGNVLENSGIYENMAKSLSHFIVEGISFFASFLMASILVQGLAKLLNIVSYLPIVKDINKAFGLVAGGLKGLSIVWLAFYLLALCITSEPGRKIFVYVQESPVLLFLYQNNFLLLMIKAFMK